MDLTNNERSRWPKASHPSKDHHRNDNCSSTTTSTLTASTIDNGASSSHTPTTMPALPIHLGDDERGSGHIGHHAASSQVAEAAASSSGVRWGERCAATSAVSAVDRITEDSLARNSDKPLTDEERLRDIARRARSWEPQDKDIDVEAFPESLSAATTATVSAVDRITEDLMARNSKPLTAEQLRGIERRSSWEAQNEDTPDAAASAFPEALSATAAVSAVDRITEDLLTRNSDKPLTAEHLKVVNQRASNNLSVNFADQHRPIPVTLAAPTRDEDAMSTTAEPPAPIMKRRNSNQSVDSTGREVGDGVVAVRRRSNFSANDSTSTGKKQRARRRSSGLGNWGQRGFAQNDCPYDAESTVSTVKKNMWTRLAKKTDIWDETDEDEDLQVSLKFACLNCYHAAQVSLRATWETIKNHPHIPVVTLLVFAVLCTAGIFMVYVFSSQHEAEMRDQALDMAADTGKWFSDQLDRAILPLFSMAQFVQQLDIFKDLPGEIGQVGTAGALPHLPPRVEGGDPTHRNVTGVCDRPALVERFNDIASTIKRNAGMEGVLVNVQLAPMAVVCMLYPMNNTEDFPPGVFMDNTGAWGHDLLYDPNRAFIAKKTIPAKGVVTAGPITLRQCKDCDPTVEKAFIARLPIEMEGSSIEVDGVNYSSWGFSVVLINWNELINRSDIYERFDHKGMQFRLTRTDRNLDSTLGTYVEKTVILAQSEISDLTEENSMSVDLETTDNQWQMHVGYPQGFRPNWIGWGIAVAVIISLIISIMLFVILIEKQGHADLLHEMLPPQALRKIKRGETVVEKYGVVTIFFSDIVGYTSMSADMSPIQVMKMLNDFYSEMDKVAEKHGVFKIETIGDAYMATGGVPVRCMGPEGAAKVALFALDAIELVKNYRTAEGAQLFIRAGINSGPVVAGVVGTKRPQYTVFGDSVNAASRMESTSQKMRIQCSDMTYRLLNDAPYHTFDMEERGDVAIKGKGSMHTWWINGARKGRVSPYTSISHLSPVDDVRVDDTPEKPSDAQEQTSDIGAGRPKVPSTSSTTSTNCDARQIEEAQSAMPFRHDEEQGEIRRNSLEGSVSSLVVETPE